MERKFPVQIDLVAPIPLKASDGLSLPLEPSLPFLSLQIKHSGHFVRRKSNHKEISGDRHFLGGEIFIDRVLRRTGLSTRETAERDANQSHFEVNFYLHIDDNFSKSGNFSLSETATRQHVLLVLIAAPLVAERSLNEN